MKRFSKTRLLMAATTAIVGVALPGAAAAASAQPTLPVAPAAAAPAPAEVDQTVLAAPAATAGPVVAAGTLVDAAGHPAAGKVALLAWPNEQTLLAIKDGQHFNVPTVGWAEASADGRFAVHINPSLVPAGYVAKDGQIDLRVKGWTATSEGDSMLSAQLPSAGATTMTTPPTTGAGGTAVQVAAPSITLQLSQPRSAQPTAQPAALTTGVPGWCNGWNQIGTHLNWTTVGETLINNGSDRGQFFTNSSHSVTEGSAISYGNNVWGTFSASGSISRSNSVGGNFGYQSIWHSYQIQSQYGNYKFCSSGAVMYYTVSLIQNTGGFAEASDGFFTAAACAPTPGNGFLWNRAQTRGSDFNLSGGVSVASWIGINLSLDSAWNTTSNVTFQINRPAGSICGNNNYPSTSQRVEDMTT